MTFTEQDAERITKECFTDSCFSWDKKELHIPCDYAELTRALNLAAAEALEALRREYLDDICEVHLYYSQKEYRAAAQEAK